MKVIGIKHSPFKTKEGTEIDGYNIFCVYEEEGTTGYRAERIYISTDKLNKCKYSPRLDDEISVLYNRYGKPDQIVKSN